MRQSIQIENLTLDERHHALKRDAGPQPSAAVQTVDGPSGKAVSPKRRFTHHERCDTQRPEIEGQFDLVLMLAVIHHLLLMEQIPLPAILDRAFKGEL